MIPNFPPSFESLKALYEGFVPTFEYRRQSFRAWFAHYLKQVTLTEFEVELAKNDDATKKVKDQLRQRHFYRSATCFYRSFDLFLTFLALQRHQFGTWADVTGYYSRFNFIQALLNLLQANLFDYEDRLPADGLKNAADRTFFVYFDGINVRHLSRASLNTALGIGSTGSHKAWWKIYECLGSLDDFPEIEPLSFVLGDGYFNPAKRNAVNYSHEYISGFPELEWFDAAPDSMMSHFAFQRGRGDRDITDIDRFFVGHNPEDVDTADFYADEAQMLWCSIDCYLRIVAALEIKQDFITVEKLERLARIHLENEFPNLIAGIVLSATEVLGTEPAKEAVATEPGATDGDHSS